MPPARYVISTCLIVFTSLTVSAQSKLAIINDPDGFTFVRSGEGTDFEVVDTLFTDDFFHYQSLGNSAWVRVTAWKGRQVEGFVHVSRIQELDKLDNQMLKALITTTLLHYKSLADDFNRAWALRDSATFVTLRREVEFYSDTKYDPMLEVLPTYFCQTNDQEVLRLLLATMISDSGSANETPSIAIGRCMICNPDMVIEELDGIAAPENKDLVLDQIEWGLFNLYSVDESGHPENEEFNALKRRLSGVSGKARP
jgi:hypothetical protein